MVGVDNVVALLVLAVAGVGFVMAAFRGVPTDGHPTCRKCGYDLVRLFPCPSICPECGRKLRRLWGIRYGHRRVQRAPLAAGAVLLTIATIMAAHGLAQFVGRNGWAPFVPDWVLEGQLLEGASPARTRRSLKEMALRIKGGLVSPRRVERLVTRALEEQASTTPWAVEWGDLIDAARSRGMVEGAQLGTYARGAFPITTTVRWESDGTPVVGLGVGPIRTGESPGIWMRAQIEQMVMDGASIDPLEVHADFQDAGGASPAASVQELPMGFGKGARIQLTVVWRIRVLDGGGKVVEEWTETPPVAISKPRP